MIKPRDFIETKEGLIFAAINEDAAFLRYVPCDEGDRVKGGKRYKKVSSTLSSFEYLEKNYPMYLANKGFSFQRCPPERIQRVYDPVEKLRELCHSQNRLARKCLKLSIFFEDVPMENKGVTGSLLVDLAASTSDIDFVVYGNRHFEAARKALDDAMELKALEEVEWKTYYKKRFPGERALGFEDFLWHEKRKLNIGKIDGTFFNLLLVGDQLELRPGAPVGKLSIRCRVKDAEEAFNIPAIYRVDHGLVDTVVSFTHTYTGQAREGEEIEVSGMLERTEDRSYRIVVGTTREAPGEYIKVIDRDSDALPMPVYSF